MFGFAIFIMSMAIKAVDRNGDWQLGDDLDDTRQLN